MKNKVLLALITISLCFVAFGIMNVTAEEPYPIADEISVSAEIETIAEADWETNNTEDISVSLASTTVVTSGKVGENLTAVLTSDGVLTISGTGDMHNYNSQGMMSDSIKVLVKSIVIKPGVTTIGEYAFNGCTNLTSVTIPDSVTSIGYGAFSGCSGLTSVTIPDSVTSIGSSAFDDCDGLNSVNISNLGAWCEIDFDNSYANPLYYAKNLYVNGELLINAVIPNGVSSIGENAFCNCTNLTYLTIPNSVKSIGDNAFDGCESLADIYITDLGDWCEINFEDYDANPLSYAGSLYLNGVLVVDAVIPQGTSRIGSHAFFGYDALTSITIPNSVTSIGAGAFNSCSLTSVTIPDSVTSIGNEAFAYCTSLKAITIPNSVISIGKRAFHYIFGQRSVYINDLAAWCEIDFGDDKANPLINWDMSGGLLYVNNELVTNLVLPEDISTIKSYAFFQAGCLETVTIPSGATAIMAHAFAGADNLKKVIIPSSVTQIVGTAFDQTNLTICGFLGSPAETFAKNKGYTFEPLDEVVYTISYDACGGTNTPAAQSKGHDATFYLSGAMPTKAHCTFKGWAVTKGGDVVYQPGDAFSLNADTTLYAVWDEPTLIVDSATCVTGRNISITISLDHNPGVALVGFKVNYNKDVMTLTSATLGDIFTGELDCNLESVPFVFNAYTGSANKTESGTLVTLQFTIHDDCAEGDYDITLTDIESLNIDEDPVEFICVNGKISVKNSIPGDVTGDGKVTRSDLLRLAKHFSGFTVELDEAAADVTGDGKVTRSDLLRLAKHFSGFDVVLGN